MTIYFCSFFKTNLLFRQFQKMTTIFSTKLTDFYGIMEQYITVFRSGRRPGVGFWSPRMFSWVCTKTSTKNCKGQAEKVTRKYFKGSSDFQSSCVLEKRFINNRCRFENFTLQSWTKDIWEILHQLRKCWLAVKKKTKTRTHLCF